MKKYYEYEQCHLREDKTVAEVVKKKQCLYDESFSWYKERERCNNAWKDVDEEIGIKEGSYY